MAHPQRPWLDLEGAAVGLIGGAESSTRCFGEVRLMECPADVGASRSAVSNTTSKLPIHSPYHVGGLQGSATALQQPQGQSAGLAAAALLQALLAPFREDVLEGAGVAPEVFGDAESGDYLLGGKTLKALRKNRQDQCDQIRPWRQDALSAGCEIRLFLHRQGEQGQQGIEIRLTGEGLQVHPGHILLEKALQKKRLAVAPLETLGCRRGAGGARARHRDGGPPCRTPDTGWRPRGSWPVRPTG